MSSSVHASTTLQAPDDPSVKAVTMRGLNRQVTREGLVSLLYHASLHLDRPKYDFVYLPWAMRKACNIGLAFINFEDHTACMEFFEALQQQPELLIGFDVRYIGPATLQGRGPNLEDTVAKRGTGILYAGDAPLVFDKGKRCDLLQVVARELPDLSAQLEETKAWRQPVRHSRYSGPRQRQPWQATVPRAQEAEDETQMMGVCREGTPGASAARAEYVERLMAHPQGAAFLSRRGPEGSSATGSSSSNPMGYSGSDVPQYSVAVFPSYGGDANTSPAATTLPLPSKLTGDAGPRGGYAI